MAGFSPIILFGIWGIELALTISLDDGGFQGVDEGVGASVGHKRGRERGRKRGVPAG